MTQRGWTIYKTFDYSVLIQALYRTDNRGRTKCFEKAITHLIGKALPQRCQIRNLKEISEQYNALFVDFRSTAKAIVEFGMSHPAVGLRNGTDGDPIETQKALFTYLKFFVSMSINDIPPIRTHMMRLCDWNRFSTRVLKEARNVNKFRLCASLGFVTHTRVSRLSNRNTMRPTLTHANFYVSRWCAKLRRELARRGPQGPQGPQGPRTLVRLSRDNESKSIASNAIRVFKETGNRKQLKSALHASGARGLRSVSHTVATQEMARDLRTSGYDAASVVIQCYVCSQCMDMKNASQPYTSLCRVVYDIHTTNVQCASKDCTNVSIKPINMSADTVVCTGGESAHFICNACGIFTSMNMSDTRRYALRCEDCYVKNKT